ncbi:hypothetical protein COHA_007148 [Chlorella ohadii]|uniref:ENT domain-containing protein n=1 Tax=Chlorella ohadii TaxID=2649997 RepID=A0AAD5DNT1_9CHLO|nr:hypothetical protein COHA_007148 [Chlorella ohadii]
MATMAPLGGATLLPPQPLPAVQPPVAVLQAQAQQQARLDAYRKVVRIFMQGAYDLAKEDALASLRSALAISEQEHMAVRQEAVAEVQHQLQLTQPASQPAEPIIYDLGKPTESFEWYHIRGASPEDCVALAAGGRPPYLTGPSLLPRRTRSWSSDEEDSDDDDE